MEESPEPERRAAAGGALLDGEDEEREPLLPRIAWAQPRRSAPGTAVRMVEAAQKEGLASLNAIDEKLLFGPKDSPCCPSLDLGLPRSSPTHGGDCDHSLSSGGTRLSRPPRDPPRPAQLPSPPRGPPPGPPPAPSLLLRVSHMLVC